MKNFILALVVMLAVVAAASAHNRHPGWRYGEHRPHPYHGHYDSPYGHYHCPPRYQQPPSYGWYYYHSPYGYYRYYR